MRKSAALATVAAGLVTLGLAGCGGASPSGSGDASASGPASGAVERIAYPTAGPADPDQNWGDLYIPAGDHAPGSVPLVIYVHGGSWSTSVSAQDMAYHAGDIADQGVAVWNLEYRRLGSGGGWPTTFTDVADAIDHAPALAQDHPQLDAESPLVVGYSSGAQIGLWAGTRGDDTPEELGGPPQVTPSAVVSVAGPVDMVWSANNGNDRIIRVLEGDPEEVPERYAGVDPIQNLHPDIAVTAIHGTSDRVVPPQNSQHYVEALAEAGGTGELVLLEGADHTTAITPGTDAYAEVVEIIARTARG